MTVPRQSDIRTMARSLLGLGLLVLVAGCSRADVQAFKDLVPLRTALQQQFQHQDVQIRIVNFTGLNVSFINSPFNELSSEEKKAKAREIALFVKKNYPSIGSITNVSVTFTIHKRMYLVVNYTNSLDHYSFKTSELEDAAAPEEKTHEAPASPEPPGDNSTTASRSILSA